MSVLPSIAVLNESTTLTDSQVQMALPALQHQITYDFRPFWNAGAVLVWIPKGTTPPPSMWQLHILDNSDQAGALGYHSVTAQNQPLLKVFAATDKTYGLSWTVTTSHELLEALADPWCSAAWQTSNTQFYAVEVGDPVESDSLGYRGHDGITLLSDFVLPAWFVPGLIVPRYSFKGHAIRPLDVRPGGYASIFVSGRGWTQIQAQTDGTTKSVKPAADDMRFRDRSKGNPLISG